MKRNDAPLVVAVVVTYNRIAFLPTVIQSLKTQTVSLHKIIVVNNGSTDSTVEWLNQQNDLYIIHQDNVGGAGGFCTGVKAATEAAADWVWLMDDDVQPAKNCLQQLLHYTYVSECLHPVHFDAAGILQEEERWFNPADCNIVSYFNCSYKQGKKIWFRNIGSFEGMLISKDIVTKIGLPDKRFFLMHDDLIYGYLAYKHTNVAVVADAVMHKLPVKKSTNALYAGLYYQFRNLWLLQAYINAEMPSLQGYRRRRIQKQFAYEVYKILRQPEYSSKRKALKTLWKAYRDYKKQKQGKTF